MSDNVYLGNPNLKKANTAIEFTEDQIVEFIKCKEDPVYFAINYIKIVSLDEGLVPFDMYDFQEKLIERFHKNRFNICKMPRQTGKSTTCVSYLLHYAVFNDNVNIAILANKASTARDLLGRLQLAYENLPTWMQQGIISWNKGSLELENGSKISANSTSSSAVRGGSYNVIFLDGTLRLLGIIPPFMDIDISIVDKIAEKVETEVLPLINQAKGYIPRL